MVSAVRNVQPSLAELLDRLTVDQIKEVFDARNSASYAGEMKRIEHDLDLVFAETGVKLSARLIRLIIALAQINLHIWHIKEAMQTQPERFQEFMKLAHQLNGIRNQIKNRLLDDFIVGGQFARKTNLATDNLDGWALSVLEP